MSSVSILGNAVSKVEGILLEDIVLQRKQLTRYKKEHTPLKTDGR